MYDPQTPVPHLHRHVDDECVSPPRPPRAAPQVPGAPIKKHPTYRLMPLAHAPPTIDLDLIARLGSMDSLLMQMETQSISARTPRSHLCARILAFDD